MPEAIFKRSATLNAMLAMVWWAQCHKATVLIHRSVKHTTFPPQTPKDFKFSSRVLTDKVSRWGLVVRCGRLNEGCRQEIVSQVWPFAVRSNSSSASMPKSLLACAISASAGITSRIAVPAVAA